MRAIGELLRAAAIRRVLASARTVVYLGTATWVGRAPRLLPHHLPDRRHYHAVEHIVTWPQPSSARADLAW